MSLGLYLLDRCDSSCRYCFSWERTGATLSVSEAESILTAVRSKGHQQVTITGGEPFLHPGVLEIVDAAYGLGFRINILTNGLHVTAETSRRLAGRPRLRVRVSLDGPTPAINDRLRGAGAFERATGAIRLLVREGVQCGVGYTVYEENLDGIGAIVGLARDLGCRFVRFSPVVRLMKGKQAPASQDLHERALTRIVEAQLLAPPPAPPFVFDVPVEALTTRRCEAGVNFVAVNPDGTLLPCPLLRSDARVFRRTFSSPDDLDEMASWATAFFREMRPRLAGVCRGCEHADTCCGGCPAEKLSFDRDVYGEQPVCGVRLLKKVEERFEGLAMRSLRQAWLESMDASGEPARPRELACSRHAPFWTIPLGEGTS